MHARNRNTIQEASAHKRILVLADLVPLWNIRVEVALAIELAVIGKRAAKRRSNAKHVAHCFLVYCWDGPRMRKADRTGKRVRLLFIRIIATLAEHLGRCLEFCVDLKAYGWSVVTHDWYGLECTPDGKPRQSAGLVFELFRKSVGEYFEHVRIGNGQEQHLLSRRFCKLRPSDLYLFRNHKIHLGKHD